MTTDLLRLIQEHGQDDIESCLLRDAAGAKLIAFGEIHGQPNPFQQLGMNLLPALKGLGFSTFAIETPSNFDTHFTRFNFRLVHDQLLASQLASRQPAHAMPNEADLESSRQMETDFFKMLIAARDNEIPIVPVEHPNLHAPNARREPHITTAVSDIIKENGSAIYWGGVTHVFKRSVINSRFKCLAEGISESLGHQSVYSVAGIVECSDYYQNLRPVLANLERPLYVKTSSAPQLAKMQACVISRGPNGETGPEDDKDTFGINYGHWDALVLFPSKD